MTSRIIYPLQRSGNLLFLRANIRGLDNRNTRVRLLLDTGATYTTLPLNVLEDVGYEFNTIDRRIDIMTASGKERVPIISIAAFNFLGETLTDFSVIGLNLPSHPLMNGLLGMDFLSKFGTTIDIKNAQITMER